MFSDNALDHVSDNGLFVGCHRRTTIRFDREQDTAKIKHKVTDC